MKNNQKGFIGAAVLFIVLAIAGIAGYYFVSQNVNRPTAPTTQVSNNFDQNDTYPSKPQNEVSQLPITSPKQQENRTSNNQPKPTQTVTPKPTPTQTNPTPSLTPTPILSKIDSCKAITTSGNYVLSNDLDDEQSACLIVTNVKDVHIDCNNHTILGAPAIKFTDVQNFSLKSCQLKKLTAIGGLLYSLQIENSSQGDIYQNTFGINSYVEMSNSDNVHIHENQFMTYLTNYYGTRNTIEKNTFLLPNPKGRTSGSIALQYGSYNTIRNNNIDGGAKGIFEDDNGVDDGIVVIDEHDDIVDSNSIKNVWDCGIETDGIIINSTFSRNNTTNSGLCGIGAWYHSSWLRNTVSNNVFENTKQPFLFYRDYGFRPAGFDNKKLMPADSVAYFKDNIFSANTFKNPRDSSYSSYYIRIDPPSTLSEIPGERMPAGRDFITGNNIFSGNDLGPLKPLSFSPVTVAVDGGGNKCSVLADTNFPLKCN